MQVQVLYPGMPAPPGRAKEVAGLDPAMVRAAFVTAGELRELGALMQKGARASVITQLLSLSPCWEKARSLEAAKKLPAKARHLLLRGSRLSRPLLC